jgi:hypothetical protein
LKPIAGALGLRVSPIPPLFSSTMAFARSLKCRDPKMPCRYKNKIHHEPLRCEKVDAVALAFGYFLIHIVNENEMWQRHY